MPFLSPMRIDLGWFNASPENMKTAWGVITTTILFTIWLISQYKKEKIEVIKSNFYLPIFGFILWSIITLSWIKVDYSAYLMLAQFISYALIFLLIVNIFKEQESINSLLKIIILSMVVVSIIGLSQYYFPKFEEMQNLFMQTSKPGATFANKNMASHFIVMTLPLSFVFFINSKKKVNILIYSLSLIAGFWFLMYTFSRQAYVAISLELTVLTFFLLIDFYKYKEKSLLGQLSEIKFKIISILFISTFLFFVSNLSFDGLNFDKGGKFNRIQGLNITDGRTRFPAWINSLEIIKDNLVTGVGIGQWESTYPRYYDIKEKDIMFNEKIQLKRLHNDYLEMFVNVGLIGYFFLFWLLFLVTKKFFRVLSNVDNKYRYQALGLGLGLLGFATVAFFSFPIGVYLPAFLVLVYFSILIHIDDSSKEYLVNINIKGRSLKLFFFLILLTSSISVFTFKYTYNWLIAEHYALDARALITLKRYKSAVNYGLTALSYNKNLPDYYYMVGYSLLHLNNPKDSIFFLKKAIDISPFNTKALLQLAVAYQSKPQPDSEMELKVLEFILNFDPKNVSALSFLVKNLSTNGRTEDASIVYKRLKRNFEYFKNRGNFGPYNSIVGLTAMSVGDYKYAQYIYQDAIKLFPSAKNYYNLAVLEFDYLKDYKTGVDLAKKSLSINPNIVRHKEIRLMIEKYESITKQ